MTTRDQLFASNPMLPPHLQERVDDAVSGSPRNVTIYEKEGGHVVQFDLASRLMKDRIIFLGQAVDDPIANYLIAQMLYLQMQDPKKDINLYINSPGGSVTAGLAIYDTMQFLTCDVNTYCVGMAASMGAASLRRDEGQAVRPPEFPRDDSSGFRWGPGHRQ
ncbi:MAG: ATP-dependent protease ClpP, protease subunit [Verrucomicrobia bacterium]|nr:MAG: ATP-dependent protease ClpP, protease subunit [Verrucomicrobiota bacterium]